MVSHKRTLHNNNFFHDYNTFKLNIISNYLEKRNKNSENTNYNNNNFLYHFYNHLNFINNFHNFIWL